MIIPVRKKEQRIATIIFSNRHVWLCLCGHNRGAAERKNCLFNSPQPTKTSQGQRSPILQDSATCSCSIVDRTNQTYHITMLLARVFLVKLLSPGKGHGPPISPRSHHFHGLSYGNISNNPYPGMTTAKLLLCIKGY
jgi:hypothetical protein